MEKCKDLLVSTHVDLVLEWTEIYQENKPFSFPLFFFPSLLPWWDP